MFQQIVAGGFSVPYSSYMFMPYGRAALDGLVPQQDTEATGMCGGKVSAQAEAHHNSVKLCAIIALCMMHMNNYN